MDRVSAIKIYYYYYYLPKTLILHLSVKKAVCIQIGQKLIGCEHVYFKDKNRMGKSD